MPVNLIVALIPLVSKFLDIYIKSTASQKDDEVLNIVKKSAKYLADKDNNTLSPVLGKHIDEVKFKGDF